MIDDTMTADEARGLLATTETEIAGDGDGVWRGDPARLAGLRTLVRALRAVIALHEAAATKERHAAFYMRQAWALGVDAGMRSAAVALREVLPDAWERLRDAPEPEWPTAGVQPEAPDDAAFRAAWQAGAEAARAGDVAALRGRYARAREDATATVGSPDASRSGLAIALATEGEALCALREVEGMPLPAPPAPPQCPEAPPDGGTEPGGGGAPARGLPVAAAGEGAAFAEAAGVCERLAQSYDRLAAAASDDAAARSGWVAGVLREAADRIRGLAGGAS